MKRVIGSIEEDGIVSLKKFATDDALVQGRSVGLEENPSVVLNDRVDGFSFSDGSVFTNGVEVSKDAIVVGNGSSISCAESNDEINGRLMINERYYLEWKEEEE